MRRNMKEYKNRVSVVAVHTHTQCNLKNKKRGELR